jgi:hypothetical protein
MITVCNFRLGHIVLGFTEPCNFGLLLHDLIDDLLQLDIPLQRSAALSKDAFRSYGL